MEEKGENERKHSAEIRKRKNSLMKELEEHKLSVTQYTISFN